MFCSPVQLTDRFSNLPNLRHVFLELSLDFPEDDRLYFWKVRWCYVLRCLPSSRFFSDKPFASTKGSSAMIKCGTNSRTISVWIWFGFLLVWNYRPVPDPTFRGLRFWKEFSRFPCLWTGGGERWETFPLQSYMFSLVSPSFSILVADGEAHFRQQKRTRGMDNKRKRKFPDLFHRGGCWRSLL